MLHLTKVAAGCTDIETLAARQAHWWGAGRAGAHTRFMPKRAEELIGGSIFWIIGHRLVARIAETRLTPQTQAEVDRLLAATGPTVVRAGSLPGSKLRTQTAFIAA